ncbi:MAG: hypothetical protein RL189_2703 [Pseudomonadota bacterium]
MNKLQMVSALGLSVVSIACKVLNKTQATVQNTAGTSENVCAADETLYPMMLQALPGGVKVNPSLFPRIAENEKFAMANADQNVRLDFCMSNITGATSLKNIVVFRKGGFPEKDILQIGPEAKSGDFLELMSGNYSGFEFNQNSSALSKGLASFVVLGGGEGENGFAVAALVAQDNTGRLTALGESWIAGKLVDGDPFTKGPCQFDEVLKTESFEIGSAQLDVDRCSKTRNISGEVYTIVRVAVSDNSVKLPVSARGLREFRGDALNKVLKYSFSHHNSKDFLTLTLPEVVYERKYNLPKVTTSVKYGNERWIHAEKIAGQ